MKIIKLGMNDPAWTDTITCVITQREQGCGAVLEIGLSDLFVEVSHDAGNSNSRPTPTAYCYCPSCGSKLKVPHVGEFHEQLPEKQVWLMANGEIMGHAAQQLGKTRKARDAVRAKYKLSDW